MSSVNTERSSSSVANVSQAPSTLSRGKYCYGTCLCSLTNMGFAPVETIREDARDLLEKYSELLLESLKAKLSQP